MEKEGSGRLGIGRLLRREGPLSFFHLCFTLAWPLVLLEVLMVFRVCDEEGQMASLVGESAHLLVGQNHVMGDHLLLATL